MVCPRREPGHAAALVRVFLAGSFLHLFVPAWEGRPAEARPPRKKFCLVVDGEHRHRGTRKPTVAAALKEARVRLGPQDEVQPPMLSPLYQGTMITIRRIATREVMLEEKLLYRIVVERSGSRWQRHPIVKVAGRAGRVRNRYLVTYRDGIPIRRKRIASQVVHPAVAQVVQVQPHRRLSSRGVYGGQRMLRMIATAYDPGPLSCGPNATGRTCLGLRAGHGIVAVDPRHIPLRTRLYIPGYGHAIAGDVGGAIKGNRIDLGYASRRAALRFGRRPVTVYVLD